MIKNLTLSIALIITTSTFVQAQKADSTLSPKTFGTRNQYRTLSLGVNVGTLAPIVFIGGSNDFTNWDANFGYGLSLRKQVAHSFGIEANVLFGKLSGNNGNATGGVSGNYKSFETKLGYGIDVRGVVNVVTVDFLKRANAVNFNVAAGFGTLAFAPSYVNAANQTIDLKGTGGKGGSKDYYSETYIPLALGTKFRISDCVAFTASYTMNFMDSDKLDGRADNESKDKFSYTSVGLEFSLGAKSKPDLTWVNPIAILYDDLNDTTLGEDLKKLKSRTGTLENSIQDLKKDSDGDGVADHLDKCPATPAGTKVDGSGCPLPILETKN